MISEWNPEYYFGQSKSLARVLQTCHKHATFMASLKLQDLKGHALMGLIEEWNGSDKGMFLHGGGKTRSWIKPGWTGFAVTAQAES